MASTWPKGLFPGIYICMSIKSISEILSAFDDKEEVYVTDNIEKRQRQNQGLYSRNKSTFDFLYLVKNWENIVGKMLSENTIPLRIRNSSLIIMTKHSIFSQELSLISPIIIKKIEEIYPMFKGQIKNIKFSHGSYSTEEFNNQKEKFVTPTQKRMHKFDPRLQQKKIQAKELFKDVEDLEMKELLESLFILKD